VTLQRDDYIQIGDTRVRYTQNKGSNAITVQITPPEGVPITRGAQHEARLAQCAQDGDTQAAYLLEVLTKQKETRLQLNRIRKARAV
jgi:hypothetical protein